MPVILCSREDSGKYVMHYGVPGMRKGVLRWTNKDGSLTEAGKRHYGIGDGRMARAKDEELKNRGQQLAKKAENEYRARNNETPKAAGETSENKKFTFSAKEQKEAVAERLNTQPGRTVPLQGRKTNITGQAKYTTTGDVAANVHGPVSGEKNDSVRYEAVVDYLRAVLPIATQMKQQGMDLSSYQEEVTTLHGNLAKQYILKSGIMPPDVVGTFPEEVLQFFHERWLKNPNCGYTDFVNESVSDWAKKSEKQTKSKQR